MRCESIPQYEQFEPLDLSTTKHFTARNVSLVTPDPNPLPPSPLCYSKMGGNQEITPGKTMLLKGCLDPSPPYGGKPSWSPYKSL